MNGRLSLALGALAGMTGVMLGAFGSHALEGVLSAERLAVWETGVRYQLVHALALVAVALLARSGDSGWLRAAAVTLVFGLVLFPGSLYALCLTGIGAFGAVTPIGGVLWIAGWALLFVHALRSG